MTIARTAIRPHFPAVKETFPTADYAPATGTPIFNTGGNKYRVIPRVDFECSSLEIGASYFRAAFLALARLNQSCL